MSKEDSFFDKVYEVVQKIPYGRVTSYGAIANFLGQKRSARMVGWALNKSYTYCKFIPAYRVVNSKGLLTGKIHFFGNQTMQKLLEGEGISVENNKVENFKEFFWDPSKEIR